MAESSFTQSQTVSGDNLSGTLWLLKQISGPFIFVLMAVHFFVNHLIGEGGLLSYKQIIAYYRIWVVPIMEGIFLILVVGHSLLGVRSILLDLRPTKGIIKLINWSFLVIGVVAIIYGFWLINQITQVGLGA